MIIAFEFSAKNDGINGVDKIVYSTERKQN